MLDPRVEESLTPVVARWAAKNKEQLWPLFREIASGRVSELFGITREPTLHRIECDGNTLFSCCALVAHMVPAIFGKAATIISTDPVSGADVRIRISVELDLQDVDPKASYGSLVDCQADEFLENPRTKFCCHVKHFSSTESGAEFCKQDARRYLVRIEEFHAAALNLCHRIWGSRPRPQGVHDYGDD